ncbi:MAG: addiction module protein [Bacteroidales bacterium]|nr:addiction module protein [Bacteroidales bacterium]
MTQFTISIPDNKAAIFLEFMKSISFIEHIDIVENIPEKHKAIVRERIEKYKNNPEAYLEWDEIEKGLNLGQ